MHFVVIHEVSNEHCLCVTAHSRLMYREMVTIEDAVMAVSVMECSMQVRKNAFAFVCKAEYLQF